MFCRLMALSVLAVLPVSEANGLDLPGAYFRLMETGIKQVEQRLVGEVFADLKALESDDQRHRLFPHVILVAAVLYTKPDPSNPLYQHPTMLSLSMRIGDLLASENEQGRYEERLNSDRDTYRLTDFWSNTSEQSADAAGDKRLKPILKSWPPILPNEWTSLDSSLRSSALPPIISPFGLQRSIWQDGFSITTNGKS
jgi:hypothetical protein